MQPVTTRLWATVGIAIAGARLIAITPVAPAAPPPPAVEAPAVQLTSGLDELFTPYADLFTNTWDNTVAITKDWFADPLPFLHQMLNNQIGYAQDIFTALQSGDLGMIGQTLLDPFTGMWQNFLNVIHAALNFSADLDTSTVFDDVEEPSTGDLVSAVLSGNFHELLQNLLEGVGSPDLQAGLPVALLVDAIGIPYLGWTALVDSIEDIFADLRAGDWSGAFVAAFTMPAHLIDATLNGSGAPLNEVLSLFGISLDDLVGQQFDLGSEPVKILGQTGTAHLGNITVTDVGGNIPLGGALAPLGHPELDVTLQYSGGQVVFDERCIPILGCSTPSPINISADPDTFPVSRELTGTPIGGIVPGLVNWAPQQFADAITPSGDESGEAAAAQVDLPFVELLGLTG